MWRWLVFPSASISTYNIRREMTPALAPRQGAPVANGVFQGEQHPGLEAGIVVVDEHRPPFQEIALPFQGEVEHGVEQRVPRADEGGGCLALRREELLVEGDALVPP